MASLKRILFIAVAASVENRKDSAKLLTNVEGVVGVIGKNMHSSTVQLDHMKKNSQFLRHANQYLAESDVDPLVRTNNIEY